MLEKQKKKEIEEGRKWEIEKKGRLYNYVYAYLPTYSLEQEVTQRQFFRQRLPDLNSEFSISRNNIHTQIKGSSVHYYLPIVDGKNVWNIHFPSLFSLREIQTVSSKILIRVRFQQRNHYTSCPSFINEHTDTHI